MTSLSTTLSTMKSVDGLDALDDKMWEFFNDVSSEYGLHPKDDHEKIIEIMVDKEFDNTITIVYSVQINI